MGNFYLLPKVKWKRTHPFSPKEAELLQGPDRARVCSPGSFPNIRPFPTTREQKSLGRTQTLGPLETCPWAWHCTGPRPAPPPKVLARSHCYLNASHNLYLAPNMCQASILSHKSRYSHYTDEKTEVQGLSNLPKATQQVSNGLGREAGLRDLNPCWGRSLDGIKSLKNRHRHCPVCFSRKWGRYRT